MSAGRLGPVEPAGTNCVRLGQVERCRETARGSYPVSLYGSRFSLRDEGISAKVRVDRCDQENRIRVPFRKPPAVLLSIMINMPDIGGFSRKLKWLSKSRLGVRTLRLDHWGRGDISPAQVKAGGRLLG